MLDRIGIRSAGQATCSNSTHKRGAIELEISANYVAILLTDLRGQPVWREIAAIAPGSPEDVILGQAQDLLDAAIKRAHQDELPYSGSVSRCRASLTLNGAW